MHYRIRIEGEESIIQHAGTGIDPETHINKEISKLASKKASSRTEAEHARIRDLETIKSMWLDGDSPTVPTAAIRSCIEKAARKTREGPAIREGLIVTGSKFDHKYGDDLEEIARATQFTVPVVVQRSRILRTRAKFDLPWSVEFTVDTDPDLVDKDRLTGWLEVAGRRIGLGDWRPEKSGSYGRFTLTSIEAEG